MKALWTSRLGKICIGISACALLVYLVDRQALARAFGQISLLDIVILILISLAMIGVSVLKWRAFLGRLHIDASFGRLFRLYVVGYFFNLFMPSFLGGDIVRSLHVGPNVDRTHAVSATFLERYTGIAAMLCMALVSVCVSNDCTPQMRLAVVVLTLCFVVASVLVYLGTCNKVMRVLRFPRSLQAIADKAHESFVWGLNDGALIARVMVLSFLFHVLTVVNTLAVASAIGWLDAPWGGLFVVVPLILLVGAIPMSPQGLGIQEGAFTFFLHSVGASTEQALAVALVLRAKSYALAIVGGVLWWALRREVSARE